MPVLTHPCTLAWHVAERILLARPPPLLPFFPAAKLSWHSAGVEVGVYIDKTHTPAPSKAASNSQFEVMLDPHELESNFCDMLLQVVGSQQGITGVHVDSVQRGGVPVEVVTAALASGWQGLQELHSRMKPYLDQVSVDECLCSADDGHSALGGQLCAWKSPLVLLMIDILTWKNRCAHAIALQTASAPKALECSQQDSIRLPSKRLEHSVLLFAAGEWMATLQLNTCGAGLLSGSQLHTAMLLCYSTRD